jgi:fatty acid-binding protein DegV
MEAMRSRAKILVSVLDLGPMVRSGRISERVGKL